MYQLLFHGFPFSEDSSLDLTQQIRLCGTGSARLHLPNVAGVSEGALGWVRSLVTARGHWVSTPRPPITPSQTDYPTPNYPPNATLATSRRPDGPQPAMSGHVPHVSRDGTQRPLDVCAAAQRAP